MFGPAAWLVACNVAATATANAVLRKRLDLRVGSIVMPPGVCTASLGKPYAKDGARGIPRIGQTRDLRRSPPRAWRQVGQRRCSRRPAAEDSITSAPLS